MNILDFKPYIQKYRPLFYRFSQPLKVYLHWTAGKYDQTFNDYHLCVTGDGDIIETRELTDTPRATYMRNTGSIAIALCCCYNATPDDLGDYPPTDEQINTLAQMMAIISDVFGYEINKETFMTHGEAADIDGYGIYSGDPDCRWDLHILKNGDEVGTGGEILRGNAIFYQEQGR